MIVLKARPSSSGKYQSDGHAEDFVEKDMAAHSSLQGVVLV